MLYTFPFSAHAGISFFVAGSAGNPVGDSGGIPLRNGGSQKSFNK